MNGYNMIMASDVDARNGLGVELRDPAGGVVAEVFRDDTRSVVTFSSDAQVALPLEILEWFIARARDALLS